jgi:hypothetical protein
MKRFLSACFCSLALVAAASAQDDFDDLLSGLGESWDDAPAAEADAGDTDLDSLFADLESSDDAAAADALEASFAEEPAAEPVADESLDAFDDLTDTWSLDEPVDVVAEASDAAAAETEAAADDFADAFDDFAELPAEEPAAEEAPAGLSEEVADDVPAVEPGDEAWSFDDLEAFADEIASEPLDEPIAAGEIAPEAESEDIFAGIAEEEAIAAEESAAAEEAVVEEAQAEKPAKAKRDGGKKKDSSKKKGADKADKKASEPAPAKQEAEKPLLKPRVSEPAPVKVAPSSSGIDWSAPVAW